MLFCFFQDPSARSPTYLNYFYLNLFQFLVLECIILYQMMGGKQSKPKRSDLMGLEEFRYNLSIRYKEPALYNSWFLYPPTDPQCIDISQKLNALYRTGKAGLYETTDLNKHFGFNEIVGRGVACFLGLAIADALGANTQFVDFVKERQHPLIQEGFSEIPQKVKYQMLNDRGEVGIWTDDCSMALCLADSLLQKKLEFDPMDLRLKFLLWIQYGLNNGGRPHSIGLGGNIAQSMFDYVKNPSPYTEELDKFNNGNGSLMRLAPVPVAYHSNLKKGLNVAAKQSKTTHNGDEASQCCRLLTAIIIAQINRKQKQDPKQLLIQTCDKFQTNLKAVLALARGEKQSNEHFEEQALNPKFKKFNQSPELDRNWNWREKNFTYSITRATLQPAYIGSYCMDALSMALHISLYRDNFYEAILWATNMGGDSDTVGAIVGQITGAMYGLSHKMMHLYSQMPDVKRKEYRIFKIGYKLATAAK